MRKGEGGEKGEDRRRERKGNRAPTKAEQLSLSQLVAHPHMGGGRHACRCHRLSKRKGRETTQRHRGGEGDTGASQSEEHQPTCTISGMR